MDALPQLQLQLADRRPQGDPPRFEGFLFVTGDIEFFVADESVRKERLGTPVT